jgi:hypothetical protein
VLSIEKEVRCRLPPAHVGAKPYDLALGPII